MSVGDLVVRAYAYQYFVIGLIVEEKKVLIPAPKLDEIEYEETSYTVAWADGNITSEMDCELEWVKDGATSYNYSRLMSVNEE